MPPQSRTVSTVAAGALSSDEVNQLGRDTGQAIRAQGGFFIVRLTRTYDPWVCAAWVKGARTAVPTRVPLSRFLAQHAGQRVDLDVECTDSPRGVRCHVGSFCGRARAWWRRTSARCDMPALVVAVEVVPTPYCPLDKECRPDKR